MEYIHTDRLKNDPRRHLNWNNPSFPSALILATEFKAQVKTESAGHVLQKYPGTIQCLLLLLSVFPSIGACVQAKAFHSLRTHLRSLPPMPKNRSA